MATAHILVIILVSLIMLFLPSFGAAKMFEKAGVKGWKAFVPFYNTYIMLQIAKRPKHWVYWQLIPILGWFVTLGIYVEFSKVFGKFGLLPHALIVFTFGLYFNVIGLDKNLRYIGPEGVKLYKKSGVREWIDAAVFAIIAATLIRTFVFEAYTIPTPSMEKTLLVNDFLFVSKTAYGPRIPNTPIAMPFVHHTMPVTGGKSYAEFIKIPYVRWFESPVKRNDVVVFNFPVGDTVINRPEYQSAVTYYKALEDYGRDAVLNNPDKFPLLVRPVDKRENFIKRCVAIPGDTMEVRQGLVYINGKLNDEPAFAEMKYFVETKGQFLDPTVMQEEYDVDISDPGEFGSMGQKNIYYMLLTNDAKAKMEQAGIASNFRLVVEDAGPVFPTNDPQYSHWTRDDYGPVVMPKKGVAMPITAANFSIYERAIKVYEGNKIEWKNNQAYINDQPATSYTFKMDYFWMMGDFRHNSLDSRYWGFVPDDHIVGKASLIWFSWENGPRWKRFFKSIK